MNPSMGLARSRRDIRAHPASDTPGAASLCALSGQKTSGNGACAFRIRRKAGNPGINYWLSRKIRKATSGLVQ